MPPKLIPKLKNSQPINPKLSTHKLKNPSTHKLLHSLFPDRTSIVIFLLAFTLLLSFWQVGLLLNDEWITANQLTNLKHGSLTVDVIKYGTDRGIYNVSGRPVGAYTHALPVFALPVYYALSAVAHTYHQPATVLHPGLALCGLGTDILLPRHKAYEIRARDPGPAILRGQPAPVLLPVAIRLLELPAPSAGVRALGRNSRYKQR